MAILDDEIMQDALQDAETIEFIRQLIPQEMKDKYDDDLLYYFYDLIIEHLSESGMLESEPDEEGIVEINLEDIAKHLQEKAAKEKMGNFPIEELLLIVDAALSCDDEFEDEE